MASMLDPCTACLCEPMTILVKNLDVNSLSCPCPKPNGFESVIPASLHGPRGPELLVFFNVTAQFLFGNTKVLLLQLSPFTVWRPCGYN